MGDRIFHGGGGDGRRGQPPVDGGPRRKPRTWWEVMHPEGSEGTWRDLPKLLADSLRLVWSAGRREFLITSSLQLASALGDRRSALRCARR